MLALDVHTPMGYTLTKELPMDHTAQSQTLTLAIEGMSCEHCVKAVTQALAAIPGLAVRSVTVGNAAVESKNDAAVGKALAALDDAGFPARVATRAGNWPVGTPGSCCGGSAKPAGGSAESHGCCGN